MPDWHAISWPLTGEPWLQRVGSDLLRRAEDDARRLGFDAAAYREWLTNATGNGADAGPQRALLADTALNEASLLEHVDALLEVAQTRRQHAPALAESLSRWSDAELRITTAVAQARNEDPAAPRNRLARLGKAAGTLGHELRNPIGVIQSSVYLLGRREHEDEKTRRHIEKIGRQAGNCHRIIEDLMHLARDAAPRLESLDVAEALSLALEEAALPTAVTGRLEVPAGLRVHADAGLLQRTLVNLLRNANTAMRGTGELELGVTPSEREMTLWVRDHGPGFESQLLRVAFDPLSTTSGVGLGLALVESIMRRHGGRASAENLPEGGARVSLHFPRP